jgi:hypothetical protein
VMPRPRAQHGTEVARQLGGARRRRRGVRGDRADTPWRRDQAAVGAVAGGIVYVAVLAALRSDELRGLARVLRRRGASRTDV